MTTLAPTLGRCERRQIADNAVDEDALPRVGVRRNIHVDPGAAVGVADQGRARDDQAGLLAAQGKRDADPLAGP